MVESLQRSPQTALHSSCLLLDTGSEWIGVAVPGVRFSVNLDERRTERMNHICHKLVLKRNTRLLLFFFFFFFSFETTKEVFDFHQSDQENHGNCLTCHLQNAQTIFKASSLVFLSSPALDFQTRPFFLFFMLLFNHDSHNNSSHY